MTKLAVLLPNGNTVEVDVPDDATEVRVYAGPSPTASSSYRVIWRREVSGKLDSPPEALGGAR